ncbi:MAG: roadblock/LC7 domain-containing protein [Pseudomonadota bacterium]
MFRETLQKILDNCDGVSAVAVMDCDGLEIETVSRDPKLDIKAIGGELSYLLGQMRKATKNLRVGDLQELSIRGNNLTYLVSILSDEHFLVSVLQPSGIPGKNRYFVQLYLPSLRKNL